MDTTDYLDMFLDESDEHLQSINNHLLELEKNPEDLEVVQEIFRSAHTLKGMAGSMEFKDIQSLTHKMENVFDQIRNQSLAVTEDVMDVIFEAVEALEEMVQAISDGENGKKDVSELISQMEKLEQGEGQTAPSQNADESQPSSTANLDDYQTTVVKQAEEQGYQTYSITVKLVDDCLLKAARVYMVFEVLEDAGEVIKSDPPVENLEAEEFDESFSIVLLSQAEPSDIEAQILTVSEIERVDVSSLAVRDTANQQGPAGESESSSEDHSKEAKSNESKSKDTGTGKQASSKTIRVSSERIDHLMNLFEELVLDRGRLEDIAAKKHDQELTDTVERITRVSQDMQDLILSMRMVPVEQVFNRFPRMVRGLAKDLDKKINLEIIGAETELDRTVIDEIGDPLVHLIRNSVDHGIESPSERKELGKPETGELTLQAYHSGNHVFIEIEDDGSGINREKVARKAIENGVISSAQAANFKDEDIYQLILASGFSTSEEVSDISGRGVGLDAVKMKIASLGGHISIESEEGKGSKFSIQLPLTLSILSSLLINVQQVTYGIPLSSVIETVLLEEKDIMSAHKQNVMDFRGKIIPLVSLMDVLDIPEREEKAETRYQSVVVVKKGDKLTGLMVDSFIGKQEVVLKSLGNYLKDIFAISGATILGDGQVSLILDPNALVT
ncbi:chemotaxis protein CheA [Barrientosiimonas marina]|uniref:Chemotaxis protein CheA n=1 Tax=Lentibacillus kimchii TaxID=1542911 RepID=A0ABW2UYW9_9BACI